MIPGAQNGFYNLVISERARDRRIQKIKFDKERKKRRDIAEKNKNYPHVLTRKNGRYNVEHPNYTKSAGYKYYNIKNNPRVGQAVNYLRYKYKRSMNDIAKILGISTGTVHKKISYTRLMKGKAFDRAHKRRRTCEVKIRNEKGRVLTLKKLFSLCRTFISGHFNSIEEALGDEPP